MCLLHVSAYNLSTVRQSWLVDSFILFWASQWSMSVAGTPSMARMMSPGHKLAMEALLPGVIWRKVEQRNAVQRGKESKQRLDWNGINGREINSHHTSTKLKTELHVRQCSSPPSSKHQIIHFGIIMFISSVVLVTRHKYNMSQHLDFYLLLRDFMLFFSP